MPADLNIRVALITGAAKRVGRAIALRLAEEGFDVAFTFLKSSGEAMSLVDEVQKRGRKCLAIQADLMDPALGVEMVRTQLKGFSSRLDVLVNNASVYEPSALNQTDVGHMRRFWAIHVETPMLLCKAFALQLRAARGHVVNMLDLLAERPWPEYLSYCTSKAGLWNLTLGLARELAPEVTVNGIAPGVVEWAKDMPENEREKYLKRVPLGRAGTPQDVAEAVNFLCGAGSYVTGQVIRLDGGRSLT